MNAIEKLFPVSQQERSFQLKVRRDAGTAAPGWVQPQFVECKKCGRRATRQVWTKSLYVCPNCGVHLPIGAYYRLSTILDHGTFKELNPDLAPNDVLHFPDYQEKLAAASVKTGLKEAAVTATGRIGGVQAVAAVLDSRFFMGSMSTAVGEKITRAIEYAADKRLPLVIFSASGGARMQEGIFSLMQMAKTSAALERFSRSGGLYVSVLTHPTTGGVTASFASLGDITLAEPGALIGFAGPRVIEQTIGEKLPDGFQRSEFQLEHGFVDQVVPRTELKEVLTRILQLHAIAAAHGLLNTLGGRYALVIGCEALSRMVDPTDRTTCVLFGDGAGAAILELAEDVPFAVTLGARGSEAIRVGGPAACDTAPITMDGKAVFRFAVETMPRCLQTVLEHSQKTLADLDWVVCHQANSRIIDHCIKHLHAEPSKFYKNMDRHGNTSAASIPIALHEMVENDLLHPGQTLACIGFGGGLTWGGMLLTYEGRK